MGSRRQETSAESRDRLTAAAAELFAEKGYRATRFEDVAARAGISRGSIPWHFGDKAGLLEAVLERFSTALFGEFAATTAGLAGEALLDAVVAALRAALARPETGLFTVLAMAGEPGDGATAASARVRAGLRARMEEVGARLPLRAGVTPRDFAVALLAHVTGLHLVRRSAPDELDLDNAFALLHGFLRSLLDV